MPAAMEVVTIQHERALAPRQERISRRVRIAIDAMVFDGLKRADAAAKVGITDNSLHIALKKPAVLGYRNSQMGVLRSSAASRSVAIGEQLMDSAASEAVKADMVKWIAGLEGISPVQRSESIQHSFNHYPGLTVNIIAGSAEPLIASQMIEGKVIKQVNSLRPPVPHPSKRNAQIIEQSSGELTIPPEAGGGGKP